MVLRDLRVGGMTSYSNGVLKNAPYKIATAVSDPGILVAYPDPSNTQFSMDIAQENQWCDGVTTAGSLDSGQNVWNVADACNCDSILVLTTDAVIAIGSSLFVGVNGMVTAVTPTTDHYIIGVATSGIKSTILCDGTAGSGVLVAFNKRRTLVSVAVPAPLPTDKRNKNQKEEVKV